MTRLYAPKQLENIFICTAICRDQQWSANKQKNLTFFQPQNLPFFSLLLLSPTHNATWERAKLRPRLRTEFRELLQSTEQRLAWKFAANRETDKVGAHGVRWEERIGRESKCLVVVVVGRANFDQNYLLPLRCGEISIECKEWERNDLVGHARNFMLWYAVRAPRASFCFSVVSRGWQPRKTCVTINKNWIYLSRIV